MSQPTMFLGTILILCIATGCDPQAPADRVSSNPRVAIVPAQAKEAVLALKKLEARIQSGVSYPDYVVALGEARFPVNLFLDSPIASKHPELSSVIRDTMSNFQLAGSVWKRKIDTTLKPRDIGVVGAVRLNDVDGKEIIASIPTANKPMTGQLQEARQRNELTRARIELRVASPQDREVPLTPTMSDGAIFEEEGYLEDQQIGDRVHRPKGAQKVRIQYVELEVAFRLLWLRGSETLNKAYRLIS